MLNKDIFRTRANLIRGLAVTAVGLAHFMRPQSFDAINRQGFPENPRQFVYINGAIETVMGLLTLHPRTRRLSNILGATYVVHLISNIVRVQCSQRAISSVRAA